MSHAFIGFDNEERKGKVRAFGGKGATIKLMFPL
jgi:hypothetical protein